MKPIKDYDFNIIPTERLLLREMNPGVYHHVLNNYPNEWLMEFFGFENTNDLAIKKQNYRDGFTMFNKSFLYFQLLKKETGEFIGWCGYHTWYTQHARAEIGYGLSNESNRGKGFMKEAFAEIIGFGFEKMELNRIEAFISPANTPSIKFVERFGFTREGIMRRHYRVANNFEDSVVFSLLRHEYPK